MIPKKIHYCWFGGNPLPPLAKKCLNSWKKFCPDYEIIEWNEGNYDISSAPLYVKQAYDAKKWAFVTDYVRLQVIYEHGGIYFDTDVEVIKSFDDLLTYDAFFGFEDEKFINTGLGFGAEKNSKLLKDLMDDYNGIPFIIENGELDTTACTDRNIQIFKRYGLISNNTKQILDKSILVLPTEYFCPMNYSTGRIHKTNNTYSIHYFTASWFSLEEKREYNLSKWRAKHKILYSISVNIKIFICKMIGDNLYQYLKKIFKS